MVGIGENCSWYPSAGILPSPGVSTSESIEGHGFRPGMSYMVILGLENHAFVTGK